MSWGCLSRFIIKIFAIRSSMTDTDQEPQEIKGPARQAGPTNSITEKIFFPAA
jgi:hypothetical protein